jgi:hypothetical protein
VLIFSDMLQMEAAAKAAEAQRLLVNEGDDSD